jgi:hypothetical protein
LALVEPGAFHTGFNQRMLATKYEWMREGSYFEDQMLQLKQEELRTIRTITATSWWFDAV